MRTPQSWPQQAVVLLCLLGVCIAKAGAQPNAVVAWGDNSYGQTNVPPGLNNLAAIGAGGYHTLALQSNSTVVAWGYNYYGQTNVPAGLSNVVAVAGGTYHSLALRSNGTVAAWGFSGSGQTNVPQGLSNVVAIAGGGYHSLALQSGGTVVAWGYGAYGQTVIPPGLSSVAAIAGGNYSSLALRSNGTVIAWGDNTYGQTNIPAGLSRVAAIAGGFAHNLALQSNGTVVAWGYNNLGQTNVPAGLSNVVAIAAGGGYSLALRSDGTVVAWGDNTYNQTNARPGLSKVAAIAGGVLHSVAIAPFLLEPPPTISIALGASTNLNVTVWSVGPFGCQWSFNGLPIPGAIGTSLFISNFDLTKAGVYSIAATNGYTHATAASVLRLPDSPIVLVGGVDVGGGAITHLDVPEITISSTFGPFAEIYYTLDGSKPDFTALPYAGAFTLTNSATIRAIAYNFAYTDWAEAAPIQVRVWETYPLSATTPGGGSVSITPDPYDGGNRYLSNTVVTLTATPSNGWSFLYWTGDSAATTSVATVLMDQPRTVQAIFGTPTTLFTNGSGRVLMNPPTGPYPFGSTIQLTALPSPSYYFFGWADAATGFANPLLLTVTNANGITALFGALKSNQVSLTLLPNGNGTIAAKPAKNVYTIGETVALAAAPAVNYDFTGWSGDASGNLNPLVIVLNTNKLIKANFSMPIVFQSVGQSAGIITMAWNSITGRTYQVLYKTNLSQTTWGNLSGPTLATNDTMSASDSTAPNRQRFYRITLLP